MLVPNPWHEPGKGSVGPFYTVADKPIAKGRGHSFHRTQAGSVLALDAKGRAISEVAGLSGGPEGYFASNAYTLYRYVYPENGGPPTWAFNLEGA